MSILVKARRQLDEASYLYGFTESIPDKIAVTWFLTRKKSAQLRSTLTPRSPVGEDATVPLYGARHVVDLLGSEIYLLDEMYREHLYERLASFVPKPSDTVLDIGANVGIFAVQQARRGARVYAFEPNPDCYRRLAKAVVENGLTADIGIFNYAIGRSIGTGVIHVPNKQTALGTVVPLENAVSSRAPVVRITSLDLILPALGVDRVDLLKIDTEGAEVDVLRGAAQTLRITERIVLEYHSAALRSQVSAQLTDHGFRQVLHVDTPASFLPEAGIIYAQRSTPKEEHQ